MIKNILFVVVIIVLWLAFFYEEKGPEDPFAVFDDRPAKVSAPRFECAGKKECWEMDSCEEAKYYLRKCRAAGLDPDGDSIPCENLCTGG